MARQRQPGAPDRMRLRQQRRHPAEPSGQDFYRKGRSREGVDEGVNEHHYRAASAFPGVGVEEDLSQQHPQRNRADRSKQQQGQRRKRIALPETHAKERDAHQQSQKRRESARDIATSHPAEKERVDARWSHHNSLKR